MDRILKNGIGASLGRASGTMNEFPSKFLTNKSALPQNETQTGRDKDYLR